jgi:hypothetical protein
MAEVHVTTVPSAVVVDWQLGDCTTGATCEQTNNPAGAPGSKRSGAERPPIVRGCGPACATSRAVRTACTGQCAANSPQVRMRQQAGREPCGLDEWARPRGGVGAVGACMRDDRHVLHEAGLREGRRRAHLQRDDL